MGPALGDHTAALLLLDVVVPDGPRRVHDAVQVVLGDGLDRRLGILERMGELDTAREMVVQCRTGARSADVIRLLRQHGFSKMVNLVGGINRWADEVDPSLPKY